MPLAVRALTIAACRRNVADEAVAQRLSQLTAGTPDDLRAQLAVAVSDPAQRELLIGLLPSSSATAFGPYRPLAHLADGGMASLWLCAAPEADHLVVVKTLQGTADQGDAVSVAQRRFEREATLTSRLRHSNIVRALASGARPDGMSWLALEFVAGGSLDELVRRRGPLPETVALRLLAQVADALSEAHRLKLVHRDLKPANILIGSDGTVKLADFGLARGGADSATSLTLTGMVVGSPSFMAPEQVAGRSGIDIRADLYAAGCVLAFCLLGRSPFVGGIREQMWAHLHQPPPDLAGVAGPACAAVVARCMAKEPGERFADPLEFYVALRKAALDASDRGGPDPLVWFGVQSTPGPLPATDEEPRRPASPIIYREPEALQRRAVGSRSRRSRSSTEVLGEPGGVNGLGPWLALLSHADGSGVAVHLHAGPQVTIGKLARVPVQITALLYPIQSHGEACNRVGRTHCQIEHRNGRFLLRDLGSTNGTTCAGTALPAHGESMLADSVASVALLAGVVPFALRPIVRRNEVEGITLGSSAHECLTITRPENRPELSYALVLRRVRIGGNGADVVLPGATAGAWAELARSDDAWWLAVSWGWSRLHHGGEVDCGGIVLRAEVGDHRLLV